MIRTIAVLGGGKDSLGILKRIKEMGLYTLVFDYDEDAPAREHLADHFVALSCYDAWPILRYFKLQTLWQPSAVLCAGTDCPDVMATLNKRFSLAGPKPRTAEISKNKWIQKKLFSEAGINVPAWVAGNEHRAGVQPCSLDICTDVTRTQHVTLKWSHSCSDQCFNGLQSW